MGEEQSLKEDVDALDTLCTRDSIEKLIETGDMVLLYFSSKTCGVCTVIKPRVEEMLDKYPNINAVYIDVEASRDIAVQYSIFTIPGILLFVDGKESIREARYINIKEIDTKISRYYSILFD